jgi:RNA polymerase sigma-70 factor (ECF subfamily)
MFRGSVDVTQSIAEARAGSPNSLGLALDACRAYLLKAAEEELDADLRVKVSASDVVQQTLLHAVRGFDGFRGNTEAELLAWLRRQLLNNLVNTARLYREAGKRRLSREVALDTGASSCAGRLDPSADISSPSEHAIAQEEREALEHAMQKLPDDYRRVLELRYQHERSFEEIGTEMGLTANAARKLWARAIKRLQVETGG